MPKKEYMCDCNIIHKEAVENVLEKMPTQKTFESLAKLFKLIGDPTRCRILFALDTEEMCVCDIANVLQMTKSAVSHQLRLLRQSQIVKTRKVGKEVYYTLDDDHIQKLFEIALEHINHQEKENKRKENKNEKL